MVDEHATEEWRDIPGFEGIYAVSDQGRVKSYARQWIAGKGVQRSKTETLLSLINDAYVRVRLTKNGKRSLPGVHQLVMLAFEPNPLGLPEVNHKDGNKHNNCRQNLEWSSFSGNALHAIATGLRSPDRRRKCTLEQAESIRARINGGASVAVLAREFNIDRKTVYGMLNGRTYKR